MMGGAVTWGVVGAATGWGSNESVQLPVPAPNATQLSVSPLQHSNVTLLVWRSSRREVPFDGRCQPSPACAARCRACCMLHTAQRGQSPHSLSRAIGAQHPIRGRCAQHPIRGRTKCKADAHPAGMVMPFAAS